MSASIVGITTPAPDTHVNQARAELRRGLDWASSQLASSTGPEGILIVAWQLEQAAAAARHLAIHALDEAGCSAEEIGDLPGVWMTPEQVIAEVLPHHAA